MKYKNINVFGLGNIGLNIANLIIYEGLTETVNLVSNQNKNLLEAIKLDLINHTPYTKENTNIEIFNSDNFIDADINIVCGGYNIKPTEERIDVLDRNKEWFDKIISQNMRGNWIVITNPDDYMAKYLLDNSNLTEKNITCLGVSLDSMRAKHKGINSILKGQHNEQITTINNESLKKATDIPFEILKHKGFTCYGIGFIVMWFLKKELMNKKTVISKFNSKNNRFEAIKV